MAKIWFRVGMEADVSEEELAILMESKCQTDRSEKLMMEIIKRAELSGETYIPAQDNGCEAYDNPEDEIDFLFW